MDRFMQMFCSSNLTKSWKHLILLLLKHHFKYELKHSSSFDWFIELVALLLLHNNESLFCFYSKTLHANIVSFFCTIICTIRKHIVNSVVSKLYKDVALQGFFHSFSDYKLKKPPRKNELIRLFFPCTMKSSPF